MLTLRLVGDIRIGLSEGVSTDVCLEAQDVDLDDTLDRDQLVTQTDNGQTVITGNRVRMTVFGSCQFF